MVVSGLHGAAQVMPSTQFGQQRAATIWGAPLGGAPNYRLYQCADGEWFFLGALFEPIYLRALDVTGVLAEVLADPEIDDLQAALVPPGALITKAKLEEAFRTKPRAEWLSLLAAADVPCGPVNTREEWFAGETIAANGMRVELEHPDYGVSADAGRLARAERDAGRCAAPRHDRIGRRNPTAQHGACNPRTSPRRTAARGREGARPRRGDRGCLRGCAARRTGRRRREDRNGGGRSLPLVPHRLLSVQPRQAVARARPQASRRQGPVLRTGRAGRRGARQLTGSACANGSASRTRLCARSTRGSSRCRSAATAGRDRRQQSRASTRCCRRRAA